MREKFWQLPLQELSEQEWEALCDGCGKCCLVKLEDDDDSGVIYTSVACRFLGADAKCTVYEQRFQKNSDCMKLTLENLPDNAYWLPSTCAYRLRFEDKELPQWHPLLTGKSLAKEHSIAGRFVSEAKVPEEDFIDYILIEESDL